LSSHHCLLADWGQGFTQTWEFRGPVSKRGKVRVTGDYACDNWEVLREWAFAGQDARIHRFPRRVVWPRTLLGQAVETKVSD